MADANSAPYASVKNRRSRAPNKRPYDSFAEGTTSTDTTQRIHTQQRAIENQTPPTQVMNTIVPAPEHNILANLQRVENERRDLLRGMIKKLNRESLEELLADAGLEHKSILTNVIAANTKAQNMLNGGAGQGKGPQLVLFPGLQTAGASKALASRPDVAKFISRYENHDLVTPPTEPKPYTTPYPPLAPIPAAPVLDPTPASAPATKSRKKAKVDNAVATSQSAPPKARGRAKSLASGTLASKPKSKPTRPYSTKKFPGRGPGRWARGTTKDDAKTPKKPAADTISPKKTASGRIVKAKYTEPETEDEEDEITDDETEDEELPENAAPTPSKSMQSTSLVPAIEYYKNGNPKRTRKPKDPADKHKEQTMIPVGILAGSANVALAGFDRRMGLIFRTSRYNRDGEFIGLGEGNRSIKRDKVDFHPVLDGLTEEELRTEILRRQQKIGYEPPPGRDISGAASGRRATTGGTLGTL